MRLDEQSMELIETASFLEEWIDQAQRRTWFLFEATRELQ